MKTRLFLLIAGALLASASLADPLVRVKLHTGQPGITATGARLALGKGATILERASDFIVVEWEDAKPSKKLEALKTVRGVYRIEPIEPPAPSHARKLESFKELQAATHRYRDRYLGYYMAMHGDDAKPEKIPGSGYLESYKQFIEERAYPGDRIDWEKYRLAEVQRDLMPSGRIGASRGGRELLNTWQFIGPKNLDIPYQTYYGQPPLGGRVNGIAYHPTNANLIYIATANGGVLKTTDGGVNWTTLSDNWPNLRTTSIAIDPTNPNVIYVGSGDWNGGLGSGYGIQKSTDGGNTWTVIGGSQFSGHAVKDILIDPDNPQIINVASSYSTSGNRLYRSTDGGATFNPTTTSSLRWSGMTIAADDGTGVKPMFAIAEGGGGVWRSLDRGASWSALSYPQSTGSADISASLVSPDRVYVVDSTNNRVYRSTDRGATWTNVSAGFPNGTTSNPTYNWSQASYDMHITVSRNGSTDVVYVGLIDLVQSPDGGATWRNIGRAYYSNSILHNDQHCMTINPQNPNEGMVGGDGGLFRLNYNPGANTWTLTSRNANLGQTTLFYHAAFHPTDPNYMIGGTQDNAAPAALGNLNNWDNPGAGDGCWQAINAQTPARQFTTWQYLGMARTDNFWSTSSTITPTTTGESVPFIGRIMPDPNNGNEVYAGTNYLHRYSRTTNAWTYRLGNVIVGNDGAATGSLRAISIAPSDSNRLYTGSTSSAVWMSTNRGTTWRQIDAGTSLPNRTIRQIAVHPTRPNEVILAVSGTGTGHVWRCLDTNATNPVWEDRSGSGATGLPDIPHNAIARDPDDPDNTWYAATDIGMFMTTDAGATWLNVTQPLGLPNVRVDGVEVVPATRSLYAVTYGRGIWRIELGNPVNLSSVTFNPSTVYAVRSLTLDIQLSAPAPAGGATVNLSVSDPTVLSAPVNVNIPAGSQSASIPVTANYVSVDTPVTVTATLGLSTQSATLNILFLLGDIDKDGEVGPGDFSRLANAFLSVPGDPNWDADADLDQDGEIGPGDFSILANQFGLP